MSAFSEDNLDSFSITFRQEILFYLHQLINDADQVSVVFNEGKDTILTMLLDVNEDTGTVILDWGSSDELNKRFMASERNFFVATPQGIRNQFITGKPRQVTYKGRPAFAVGMPKKYVRLQRRDYFRLTLPMMQRPKCVLVFKDGLRFDASVLDVGLGGVGLEIGAENLPCELNEIISDAKIEFKSFGDLRANLKICYLEKIARSAKKATHMGCQFDHLSPAQEQLLQKYITHVQREERARLGI